MDRKHAEIVGRSVVQAAGREAYIAIGMVAILTARLVTAGLEQARALKARREQDQIEAETVQ